MRVPIRILALTFAVVVVGPTMVTAQSPSPTPVPDRVGFEPMPMGPGVGGTPGGLPWQAVGPPLDAGSFLSHLTPWAGGFAAVERSSDPGGDTALLAVWSSPDGTTWTRSDSPAGVTDVWRLLPHGDDLVLASLRDPTDRYAVTVDLWGGGGALRWVGDAMLVLADSSAQEEGVSCGDRLGAWRLEPGAADWELVVDRQAAVTYGSAIDGDLVIVTGSSWCTAPDWGWILVSTDGARTWDPQLSWTGRSGTCVSDVAIRESVAIMEGCTDGGPSLWRADMASTGASPAP